MTDHELIANIHRRMDKQDELLREIRDRMNEHIITSDGMRPAIEELVTIWKGSKILIPLLIGMTGAIWAIIAWAKDHLK